MCVNRDVTTGCMRLVKPRRVFSKPANLATPFWITTLPEWRCVTVGNPRSFRNISASNICRPIRCTCGNVSPLPRAAYLWDQSSFQQFRSICYVIYFCYFIFATSSIYSNTWIFLQLPKNSLECYAARFSFIAFTSLVINTRTRVPSAKRWSSFSSCKFKYWYRDQCVCIQRLIDRIKKCFI